MRTITHLILHPSLRSRFGFLFLALTATLAIPPFIPDHPLARGLLQLFVTFLLLAGVYAVSEGKTAYWIAMLLAVPALGLSWVGHMVPTDTALVWGASFSAVFLIYVAVQVLREILRHTRVDANTVYGAICVYLLIGFTCAFGFFVIELTQPQGLHAPDWFGSNGAGEQAGRFPALVYFSFVTLTTLGYGEFTPVSSHARSLVVLEAVIGQLYLVVLIARLVGLHVAQQHQSTPGT